MLAACAAVAGAGCGDEEDIGTGLGLAAGPGGGGGVTWALGRRPRDLDPLFASTDAEQMITRQFHEPLIAELTGPFGDVRRVDGLASASPSGDASIWELRLRSAIRFGDGAPLDASAVLANVRRWQESSVGRALIGEALADAPRPDLVRFILPAPDPRFDRVLASPQLGIVSPRAIEAVGGGQLSASAAVDSGTGPFELRERGADRMLLARNTEWWGSELGLGPGVDQLEFTVIGDAAARAAALAEGEVQVASELGRELARVRRDPLLTVVDLPGPGAIGIERSIRGIPSGETAPPLNGLWRTGIAAD